jgi:hypothetical protein
MTKGADMRVAFIAFLGAIGGLVVGGAVAFSPGSRGINVFKPGNFEGYAAMIAFFVCSPIGALVGGFVGTVWAGTTASRARLHIEPDR